MVPLRKGRAIELFLVLGFASMGCATSKGRIAKNKGKVDCNVATIEPGKVVDQKEALDIGQSGAQIVGMVTFGNEPLPGVQVVATLIPKSGASSRHSGTVEFDVLSDEQGRFQILLDAPSRFVVGLYHGTYRPNLTGEFALNPGQSLKLCAKMRLED